jgi:hypothetical protein
LVLLLVAAQLLNTNGMTHLPATYYLLAVGYDVALLHGQARWHLLVDQQLLLPCHQQGS